MLMFGWFLLFMYGAECGLGSRNTPLRVGFTRPEGREGKDWDEGFWDGLGFYFMRFVYSDTDTLHSPAFPFGWYRAVGAGRNVLKEWEGYRWVIVMADMFLEMARLCDLSTIETGYQKDPPAGTTTTTKKQEGVWAPDIPPRHS